MSESKVNILDCTLRDGSYLIDYQFTAEDTYLVCLGLSKAGHPKHPLYIAYVVQPALWV